jgi:hypothetical protein
MSTLASRHTMALLVGSAGVERRPHDPERRRAAVHAALRAYAGRLRRLYDLPAPRPEHSKISLRRAQLRFPPALEPAAARPLARIR